MHDILKIINKIFPAHKGKYFMQSTQIDLVVGFLMTRKHVHWFEFD